MKSVSIALIAGSFLLQGCGMMQRLSNVGSPPTMTKITDPTKDPDYRPVTQPMPHTEAAIAGANSLWRPGSRAFFKDQRAAQVGDIVTVTVNMTDAATMTNVTEADRDSAQVMGMSNMFGLQGTVSRALPGGKVDTSQLVNTNTTGKAIGTGNLKRGEQVQLRVAAAITQVLANGNLVVAGKQEVRVNSELRELLVTGIMRPQDILSDNTIPHDRLAEARISYGGRGQLTDVQTARWGQQILDILSPF